MFFLLELSDKMKAPLLVHPSLTTTPEKSAAARLQQDQIPLSLAKGKIVSTSTSIQRDFASNEISQSPKAAAKIMLPMEINIDDSSSCGSVSHLDDTSSKKLSPCSSSSIDSRESISSVDDENRASTPKTKKKRSTRKAAAIVTPDPPKIASPVLTKGMADYVLGDSQSLPGSNDGNFILTKDTTKALNYFKKFVRFG